MRPLISIVSCLDLPAPLFAQSDDIQREIETLLWYNRVLGPIEDATGLSPAQMLLVLLAFLLAAILVGVWLWRSRSS